MSQTRKLMPMDIVEHDSRMWVVSTAHLLDSQGRQQCHLSEYYTRERKEFVPYFQCRLITPQEERETVDKGGIHFFPNEYKN